MAGRPILQLLIILTCLAAPPGARAELGGDVASVRADAAQLNGVLQSLAAPPATGMSITIDNGISVHEFVDAGGLVFAVRWSGPAVPDLRVLLGRFFTAYTAGLATLANPGRQRAIQVVSADLVVRTGGHLRAYTGLAYLRDRIPPGTVIENLP